AVLLVVTGTHLPYAVAVPIGFLTALATGALVERTVVRRFFNAPRLILMVATLGVVQLVGAAEVILPQKLGQPSALSTFHTPFDFTFSLRPLVFTGDHIVALVV